MSDYVDLPVYGGLSKTTGLPPKRFYLPHEFVLSSAKALFAIPIIALLSILFAFPAGALISTGVSDLFSLMLLLFLLWCAALMLWSVIGLFYDLMVPFSVRVLSEGIVDPRISPDLIPWSSVRGVHQVYTGCLPITAGIWLSLSDPVRIKTRPFWRLASQPAPKAADPDILYEKCGRYGLRHSGTRATREGLTDTQLLRLLVMFSHLMVDISLG